MLVLLVGLRTLVLLSEMLCQPQNTGIDWSRRGAFQRNLVWS